MACAWTKASREPQVQMGRGLRYLHPFNYTGLVAWAVSGSVSQHHVWSDTHTAGQGYASSGGVASQVQPWGHKRVSQGTCVVACSRVFLPKCSVGGTPVGLPGVVREELSCTGSAITNLSACMAFSGSVGPMGPR